jgi:hypothetical protein
VTNFQQAHLSQALKQRPNRLAEDNAWTADLTPSSQAENQLLHLEKGKLKERMMSTRRIPMMTEDEIQAELGWIRP